MSDAMAVRAKRNKVTNWIKAPRLLHQRHGFQVMDLDHFPRERAIYVRHLNPASTARESIMAKTDCSVVTTALIAA